MATVGVICPYDDSLQSFDTCIACHENRSTERNCHAPIAVLKSGRDNHKHRKGAGISMSTLISCPRAIAIHDKLDVYESVISLWNKGRGTFVHAMMEYDPDPPPWIIRERRLYREVNGIKVTGKPDEVDTKFKVLVDYKSKDNLPKKIDESHEFQFNGYAWLLRHGYWADTDEKADIDIEVIAAHYLTWKTKADLAWRKMKYPVWQDEDTDAIITARVEPLTNYFTYGILPECNPYIKARYWKCDCEKYEEQLTSRGVDMHAAFN